MNPDHYFEYSLTAPGGQEEIVNIVQFDKSTPQGDQFRTWKVYFIGLVVEVNRDLTISPDQPKPEWHQMILEKVKELFKM